ncbi:arginine synthesis PII-interacting regulator PirA [Leptolyngbya sp. GGD]|uniref:arginine synthesis PII-interacting regulator PirA n=1 Tax=Leptolyngbya sp. GGD TaxID=2997907 RepID=UPI00227A3C4F|nr:DUF4278 domain-containing protein [Leptolyngbya sp. GGD]MCY6489328.1 DUF4278 domain-containing protein [Leptolyngbya sp. GGD]
MRLIYRGVEYEYDPTQPRTNLVDRVFSSREPITLTYRGNRYQMDPTQPAQPAEARRPHELIYRGVRYWVGASGDRPVTSRLNTIANLAATHHANLQRNLQHRIEVARQNGDYNLLSLLEAERNQLV